MKEPKLSRRTFLQTSGFIAAAAAVTGIVGCTDKNAAGSGAQSAQQGVPEHWDYETDILIVGYGGAGAAAAITVASEGLGEMVVIDAAPADMEGGNTRVSANLICIPENEDDAITYQKALNSTHLVEDELLKGWARNLCENGEWLDSLGIKLVSMSAYAPEFPELPGSESIKTYCVDGKTGYHAFWNALKEQQEYFGFEVMHGTRGLELIRNSMTNEALGIRADQNGTLITIKARKAVILSCGGFENDPQMIAEYALLGQSVKPNGSPYNVGDGIRMVAPFGAQLWHMNNVSGTTLCVLGEGLDGAATSTALGYAALPLHSYIFVGQDGKRFMYEETNHNHRHGKIVRGGLYVDAFTPEKAWAIFDQTFFDNVTITSYMESETGWASTYKTFIADDNQGFLEKGIIIKADTIEDLAQQTGLPLDGIKKTLNDYNSSYVPSGKDPDFKRGEAVYGDSVYRHGEDSGDAVSSNETVAAFPLSPILPPFYATPLVGGIYNTQGGPKRNGDGQLLDYNNKVINRLYGAGEFGAIYGYMYNGGGNVSDAIGSGRAAARHAASLTAWDV